MEQHFHKGFGALKGDSPHGQTGCSEPEPNTLLEVASETAGRLEAALKAAEDVAAVLFGPGPQGPAEAHKQVGLEQVLAHNRSLAGQLEAALDRIGKRVGK
jgi:hypothetical protein